MIGHSLEADVLVKTEDKDLSDFIEKEWQTIKEISIISELSAMGDDTADDGILFQSEEISGLFIRVIGAAGGKSERCWIRSTTVGEHPKHPSICERCAAVVTGEA